MQPAADPNQNPYGEQYGNADVINNSSYLSEIAAAPPPQQSVWPKRLAIIGGAIVGIFALFFIVINAASDPKPSIAADAQTAFGRSASLDTLASDFAASFDSSELRAVSSELRATLNSFERDISVILDANGVGSPKAPATEAAYLAAIEQKFHDAYILGNLERTYVSEMTYQIELFRSMLVQIENKLTSLDQRNFLTRINSELEGIQTRFGRIPLP